MIAAGLVGCGGGTPEGGAADSKTAEKAPAVRAEPLPELRPIEGYGFQPRACGFDLNDDGEIGGAGDCGICDGTTTDPDGDGVDEDLVYVSCSAQGENPAGEDVTGCGSPDRPCATLGFAFASLDGPTDGAEDVVCFRGTCRLDETLEPKTSGVDGVVTVAATGSQERDFERPKDPAMLVGWDTDGDGEYPPFDVDDEAVIDGGAGPDRAMRFGPTADRFELAHFTARGFGMAADGKDSGLIATGTGQGELTHLYLHDMYWPEINKGRSAGTSVTTVDLFSQKTRIRWLWLDNIWAPRNGGWWVRGAGQDEGPDGGPFRFQNLTVTARGCNFDDCGSGAAFTGFHLWGYLSGVEILDSHFNAGVDEWQPKPKGGPSGARFALVAQCSQDWTLRHNLVEDFKNAVRVQGWAERYCDDAAARPVGPVKIDRNRFTNDYGPWTGGDIAVYVSEGGEDAAEVVGDVDVTHNIMSAPGGWESCVWLHGGNGATTPEGRLRVAYNTCAGKIDYHGALVLGDTGGVVPAHPHARVEVVGNLITGLRAEDPNLRLTYPPLPGWVLSRNVFDSAGVFHFGDQSFADLASWTEAVGFDPESEVCLPSFVDFERGDFHLQSDDTCAAGHGAALPDGPAVDQEGQTRPDEGWDIGAVQRQGG